MEKENQTILLKQEELKLNENHNEEDEFFTKEEILFYMGESLKECENGINNGEVPVGCVFFHLPSKSIIARSHNLTNQKTNAITHAEINCINYIYNLLKNKQELKISGVSYDLKNIFSDCVLFVSCEPCIMCAYALSLVSMYINIKFSFFRNSKSIFRL